MNRVLIVAVAAAAMYYALRAREVPNLAAALWEREARIRELERECGELRTARLTEQRPATVARIAAERRVHRGYTEAGLLRMAGLRDCQ